MISHMRRNCSGAAPVTSKKRRSGPYPLRKSLSRRNFLCNQCHDAFNSLRDLERHTVNTHVSYRCTYCDANFTQRSNLQRHSLKHVGFKPFECGICDKSYFRKDHLMRHMETSHPSVPACENIRILLTSSQSLDYLSSHKEEVSEALRIEASRVSEDAERVPFDELEDIDTSSEITQIPHFLLT